MKRPFGLPIPSPVPPDPERIPTEYVRTPGCQKKARGVRSENRESEPVRRIPTQWEMALGLLWIRGELPKPKFCLRIQGEFALAFNQVETTQ